VVIGVVVLLLAEGADAGGPQRVRVRLLGEVWLCGSATMVLLQEPQWCSSCWCFSSRRRHRLRQRRWCCCRRRSARRAGATFRGGGIG
jgi:hypothetical protein